MVSWAERPGLAAGDRAGLIYNRAAERNEARRLHTGAAVAEKSLDPLFQGGTLFSPLTTGRSLVGDYTALIPIYSRLYLLLYRKD